MAARARAGRHRPGDRGGTACALGGGDLDADAVLDGLRRISFGGWLVVEQDILARSAERFARAAAEQRHNREFLAARGL